MSEWRQWDGSYEKEWHDVLLPNGKVVEHCWPNAGLMGASDGSGRMWRPVDGIKVRTGQRPLIHEERFPRSAVLA